MSVYTDSFLCGSEFLPNKAFNLALNRLAAGKFLRVNPIKDVSVGLVVQFEFDLGGVHFVIPVLLINTLLRFPGTFFLHGRPHRLSLPVYFTLTSCSLCQR